MKIVPASIKSITLVELIISILIISAMVLSFYSLELFTQGQVINSDRMTKVQNDLAYCLEHMSKYVQRANGNKANPAIILGGSGFQVRVDFRDPQVPSDLNNGAWVSYSLTGSTLSSNCAAYGVSGTCGSFLAPEVLSNKIITFSVTQDAAPLDNVIEIDLVGRYNPSIASDRTTNPQIEMKTKVICPNHSTN